MSWVDKAHKRNNVHKMIEQAMNTQKYKEARRKDMEQATLQALARFCFICLMYLELNFRCKSAGMLKFLKFVKKNVEEIGKDEEMLETANGYYKEYFNIDVMRFLGMEFTKDGDEDANV